MISKNYLDEERKKLWQEVISLKQDVGALREELAKRTPEYEAEARQSSKKASEFRNRSLDAKEAAETALTEVLRIKGTFDDEYNSFINKKESVESVLTISNDALGKIRAFEEKSADIDELFSKYDEYVNTVEEIESLYSKGEDISSKSVVLYNAISKKKREIDDIHREIFGYEEEDEQTGETKSIEGLKNELDESYDNLRTNIDSIEKDLENLEITSKERSENYFEQQNTTIAKKLESWNGEHAAVTKRINDLLPDALTAGLSHAFSEKRSSEIVSGEKLSRVFNWSILALVIVSLIPFAVNAYLLHIGKPLEDIITDMPRLLTAIIPLYIPLVWLAYSSNKKANLSKRLVEEYTHKEVLSKTFEGLSSQIDSIEESNISNELRMKLLYNLLDVSAENPGKLISNYNTSDHPLFEALESSSKFNDSIKKLEKIPGLSKLVRILDKKSKADFEKQSKKVDEALNNVDVQ
ncbi:hypothetical protein [Saccharospirillum alexandrii]|uniref:hypothetical protein n=1 Tax=Saccharospirillum alexandrii TaxID=2448477 RepID=UPI00373505BB